MLIFISDLHMSDGTAGPVNVPPAAFTGTFADLADHARSANAKEITLVFLGDVFDLIRTARWFNDDIPPDEKPWGATPTEAAALKVMNGVIDTNSEVFTKILPGSYMEQFSFPVEPKRVFIPGNHDRPCNMHPLLRQRVVETLGITHLDSDTPIAGVDLTTMGFKHYYLDLDHGAFARHGHEFDSFNFEGSTAFSHIEWVDIPDIDYQQTPIGDVIACEIASKLPFIVIDKLPKAHPSRNALLLRLMDLFDVRHLVGIAAWLAYQVDQFNDPQVTDAINKGVSQVAQEFEALPFVKAWIKKHDSWINPFALGNELELLIKLIETFKFSTIEKALPLAEKLKGLLSSDNFASKSADEFRRLDSNPAWKNRISYVLYGHTHVPDQRAIDIIGSAPDETGRVYINTGMWRPSQNQGVTGGFVSWKNLTYSIIYQPGERPSEGKTKQFPTFETWSGALKDS